MNEPRVVSLRSTLGMNTCRSDENEDAPARDDYFSQSEDEKSAEKIMDVDI